MIEKLLLLWYNKNKVRCDLFSNFFVSTTTHQKLIFMKYFVHIINKLKCDSSNTQAVMCIEGEQMKEYNKANIPLAKTLRKNMTPWERKLWYEFLRNDPIRFQRQKNLLEAI